MDFLSLACLPRLIQPNIPNYNHKFQITPPGGFLLSEQQVSSFFGRNDDMIAT
jgi:hypothetical protein